MTSAGFLLCSTWSGRAIRPYLKAFFTWVFRNSKPRGTRIGIYTNLCAGGTADISRWWNHRKQSGSLSSPGGATDRLGSVAPPGLGNWSDAVPVVPPPANIRRPSGTKTHLLTYVDTNACPPWLIQPELSNRRRWRTT